MGKIKMQSASASSILKYKARRERGNEYAKLKRLKQPFAGTGMVKLGVYKTQTNREFEKAEKAKKKTLVSNFVEENNIEEVSAEIKAVKVKKKATVSNIGEENNVEEVSESNFVEDNIIEDFTGTRDINIERRKMLEKEVETMEFLSQAAQTSSSPIPQHERTRKTWQQRMSERAESWEQCKAEYYKAFIHSQAFVSNICINCFTKINCYVKCKTCHGTFCHECDQNQHSTSPFHQRTLFTKNNSQILLPTQFINCDGELISQDISVPCMVPTTCLSCLKTGTCRAQPSLVKVAVITTEGRYDLNWTEFQCSDCKAVYSATESDLIASGWWPGTPKSKSYLFSMDLLIMWKHLAHKTPGTSERKFLETLGEISKLACRSHVIDRQSFSMANRYFQQMDFLVEVEIRLRKLFTCKACGAKPLAIHIDGIMKLYRWLSAQGHDLSQLLPDVGFVEDSVFESHAEKINKVKPKVGKVSKDSCGGATYKAGKSDAIGRKGLSETGVVFGTCRHGYLLRAVDMLKGETYRHVHYLHDYAYRIGCKFICYDVVCKYWPFAEDISEAIDEFEFHTQNMEPFLSRWHGKTHAWYCQILYSGHWMKGACLTTGESTEQTNSKMARYGSATKHMGRSNRRDHLTLAMIYANNEKEERMARLLRKSLTSAEASVVRYEREFYRLANERKDKLLLIQTTIKEKLGKANAEMLQFLKEIKEIVSSGPPCQESLAQGHKLQQSLKEVKLVKERLEEAKKKNEIDLNENILLKLPLIVDQLKHEARECQNKRFSDKTPLSVSQKSLEGIHLIIKNIKNRISKETDASKQRIELKKQMGKYVEKATKLVAVINRQQEESVVTMDDCYRGVFPWQSAYDISFQENFNLVDTWMLTERSKEEICQLKEEMRRFKSGLVDAKKNLDEEFKKHLDSEDLLLRGKAFLMQPEIKRLSRLLHDCDHWFCETSTDSNSDIAHEVGEPYDHYYETDSESMGEDDVDQETKSEDELNNSDCESNHDEELVY